MKNNADIVEAASLSNDVGQNPKQPWCALLSFQVNADR